MATTVRETTNIIRLPLLTRDYQGTIDFRDPESPQPGPSSVSSSSVTRVAGSDYVYKSSTTTAGFYNILKSGGFLPNNNFAHRSVQIRECSGFRQEQTYSYGILRRDLTYVGAFGFNSSFSLSNNPVDLPSTSQLDALDREAVTKIRLKLKDQKVNVAQIIAERDKTAQSITKIVKTITQMLLSLRKGDLKGAGEAAGKHVGWKRSRNYRRDHRSNPAEAASNAWLELQYAIRPLLMDATGLAEALAKQQYRPVRGRVVAVKTLSGKKTRVSTESGYSKVLTLEYKYSIKYAISYQLDFPAMPDFAGLGLTNPAQLAWELVPYSFVIDWLLPIGDFLSSIDGTVGLSFSDGSKSVKEDYTYTGAWNYSSNGVSRGTGTKITESYAASRVVNAVDRTKLVSFPPVALPAFKNPASITHLFSSLALLVKAVVKISRA